MSRESKARYNLTLIGLGTLMAPVFKIAFRLAISPSNIALACKTYILNKWTLLYNMFHTFTDEFCFTKTISFFPSLWVNS